MDYFNITDCRDNFANFLADFPAVINKVEQFYPKYPAMFKNYTLRTYARPQDLLFNLPMFYIGK